MTCSLESTCLTRIRGVEDLVVDFRGSGRLNPQSPRERDVEGVVTVCRVGYGVVAEEDRFWVAVVTLFFGGFNGAGSENMRDDRSRAPPGDIDFPIVVPVAL